MRESSHFSDSSIAAYSGWRQRTADAASRRRRRPAAKAAEGNLNHPAEAWTGGALACVVPIDNIGPHAGWFHKGLVQKPEYGEGPGAWRFVEASTSRMAKAGPVERCRVGRYGPAKAVPPPQADLNIEALNVRLRHVSPCANLEPATFRERHYPFMSEDLDNPPGSASGDSEALEASRAEKERQAAAKKAPKKKKAAGDLPSTPGSTSREVAALLKQATWHVDGSDREKAQQVLEQSANGASTWNLGDSRGDATLYASPDMLVPADGLVAQPSLSRLISLKMQRWAMAKGFRSRTQKHHDRLQKAFQELAGDERSFLEQAFRRSSGYSAPQTLTAKEAFGCAAVIGLSGYCEELQQKIWQLCVEAVDSCGTAPAGSQQPLSMVAIASGRLRPSGTASETVYSGDNEEGLPALPSAEGEGIPLPEFAIGLLPQLRDAMHEQYIQDFQRVYCTMTGSPAPELLEVDQAAEVAVQFGFDRTHFVATLEGMCLGMEATGVVPQVLALAAGTPRGKATMEMVAHAAVWCREQVLATISKRTWQAKEKLEADIIADTDTEDFLDLRDAFEAYADGSDTISASEAIAIMSSIGYIPEEMLGDDLTVLQQKERHSFSSLVRQAQLASEHIRLQHFDASTTAFQVRLQVDQHDLPVFEIGHLLNDAGLVPRNHEEQAEIRDAVAGLHQKAGGGPFDLGRFQALCVVIAKCLNRKRWESLQEKAFRNAAAPMRKHKRSASTDQDSPVMHSRLSTSSCGPGDAEVSSPQQPAAAEQSPLPDWLQPPAMRQILRWLKVPRQVIQCFNNQDLAPILARYIGLRRTAAQGSLATVLQQELDLENLAAMYRFAVTCGEKSLQATDRMLP